MHRDRRRLNALLRDHGRLRVALECQEKARFDLEAAAEVRVRTEDLLETVSFIVHDEDFWERLRQDTAAPLTPEQIQRLRNVDSEAFAVLLEAAGYRSPPPPPAHELVDDTVASLSMVLDTSGPPDPGRISTAQFNLITLTWRVRRQIKRPAPDALQGPRERAASRRLLRAGQVLIPPALGVAVGAFIEANLPTGMGLVVGKAVTKVSEDGTEWVARSILGADWAEPRPIQQQDSEEVYLAPSEALEAHLAILSDRLHNIANRLPDEGILLGWPRETVDPQDVRDAVRRAYRISELCVDHNAISALGEAAADLQDSLSVAVGSLGDAAGTRSRRQNEKLRSAIHDSLAALERAQKAKGLLIGANQRPDGDQHAYSQGEFAEHPPMTDPYAAERMYTSTTVSEDTQTTTGSAGVSEATTTEQDEEPPQQMHRSH